MKHSLLSYLSIVSLFFRCSFSEMNDKLTVNKADMTTNRVLIKIGSSAFNATLQDNQTTKAFKALLPFTTNMIELNGNEKYAELPENLVTHASNPRTIQSGDLMLYGSNTLVLFYKSFSTSYSYTRLGRIDNVSGLASALGSGNVTIAFEREK
jgi:hypothetical protein